MEVDRDDLIAQLEEQGHSRKAAEKLVGTGEFHQVDETKKIVMGKCSHSFEVDEPGTVAHIVCTKCGFGKYTNKLPQQ